MFAERTTVFFPLPASTPICMRLFSFSPCWMELAMCLALKEHNLAEAWSQSFKKTLCPHSHSELCHHCENKHGLAWCKRRSPEEQEQAVPAEALSGRQITADWTADQGQMGKSSGIWGNTLLDSAQIAYLQDHWKMHGCEFKLLSFGMACYIANANICDTKPRNKCLCSFFSHVSNCSITLPHLTQKTERRN